jgi:hypothetical protein
VFEAIDDLCKLSLFDDDLFTNTLQFLGILTKNDASYFK